MSAFRCQYARVAVISPAKKEVKMRWDVYHLIQSSGTRALSLKVDWVMQTGQPGTPKGD